MLRLAIRVRRAEAELVLAELLELAPSGVEEVDVDAGTVEYAVYGAPGELPELPDLQARAGSALVEVATTELADDWAERWREFHRPLRLGGRLGVRPPWERRLGTGVEIVIDPGRAFGTGAHATTRLCLELLLELDPPDPAAPPPATGPVAVDLGCGSGVLAIAAAQLGWGPVLALDHDRLAVDATLENARINGVAGELEAHRFDLREQRVPQAPLVLANLLAPLLLAWVNQLREAPLTEPTTLIASGLLVNEADAISEAFASVSLDEADRRANGDWAAILLHSRDRG